MLMSCCLCVPPPGLFLMMPSPASFLSSLSTHTRDATDGFSGRLVQRWPRKTRTRDRVIMRERRGGSRGSGTRRIRFRCQNERADTICSSSTR
jgi:hypothetical protein